MPLVRCPKHKIPYNDENPRGCPACALEKEGGGEAQVMQELARATQGPRRTTGAQAPPVEAPPRRSSAGTPSPEGGPRRSSASQPVPPDFPLPVTPPPRIPVPRPSAVAAVVDVLTGRRVLTAGVAAIAVLGLYLVLTSGPRFTTALSPPTITGPARPLGIEPNDAIGVVFSVLGPQAPQTNPTGRSLARYPYGSDLVIDALNNSVYAITFSVANRSWHGLQVGMNQQTAVGALALLGPPREPEPAFVPVVDTVGGYLTYRSLDTRPRRTFVAEVRPPNGCFDVMVDIQPRAIGTLIRSGRRYAAVATSGAPVEWVATRIRALSRALPGPYSGAPVC